MKNLKVKVGSNFTFLCDSSILIKVLAKANNVTTTLSNSAEYEKKYIMFAYKGKLYVIGHSADTFIALNVKDAKVKGEGSFGYDPKILPGVIKNRADMEFTFNKGRLEFKSVKGRYEGNIDTIEVGTDQIPYLESNMRVRKDSTKPLSADMLKSIREGVKFSDLKDFYNNESIICNIRSRKGTLDISALDNFHMAYYRTRVDFKDNFTLAIPVEVFKLIDKFISDEDVVADFHMNSKEFKVSCESFVVVLPPVQVDSGHFDLVPNYIKSLGTDAVAEVPFTHSAINTVDNMFTLANDETRLSLDINKTGRIDISLTTEQGTIADAFKFKDVYCKLSKIKALVDPRIFEDLFKKVKDRKIVNVRFFKKKNSGVSSSFLIAANSDAAKAYLVGTYYEDNER